MFSIRDTDFEIGDCLFIRVGGAEVRFGNVEDTSDSMICVSFARQHSRRREAPEWFKVSDVLRYDEIDATPPGQLPEVGLNYMLPVGRDRVRVLRVISVDRPNALAEVAPVLLDSVGSLGEREMVNAGDLHAPALFARIARWRYEQPNHPLVDVFQAPVGESQSFEGAATLNLKDIAVPVNVRATFRAYKAAFELDAHYQIAGLVTSVAPEFLAGERLIPEPPSAMPWHAMVAVFGGRLHASGSQFLGSINVVPQSVVFIHREAPVSVTREIYSGAPWRVWSHPIFYREPPVNPLMLMLRLGPTRDSVQFDWKGVTMTLYRPHFTDSVDAVDDHLAVVRVGKPLPPEDKAVMGAFIGYCTGGRARNVATETFDMDGKLATVIHDRGQPTTRRSPPMPLDQPSPYVVPFVIAHLPTILDAMTTWRARDFRSFDAVFHHYAEGVDSAYPVTRTLRLAVAFEAFVNLVTQDFAENERIMDSDFETVRDALYAGINGQLQPNGPLTSVQHQRLRNKIMNLNSASNTRRQRSFWASVPIDRTNADDALLRRLRDESVHRGYVGEDQTPEGLLEAAADADGLTDLFNRAVLTYAGYSGPVRSSVNGSWLEPISAQRYRVPGLPTNPTLEIQHAVSMPSMTPSEQAAYDALLLNQRAVEDPHYVVDPLLEWGS
jgi:hypothetical protein